LAQKLLKLSDRSRNWGLRVDGDDHRLESAGRSENLTRLIERSPVE